jgi:hypothetical protein
MRTLNVRTLGPLVALLVSLTIGAFAVQPPPRTPPTNVLPEDQAAIEEVFKDVDPSQYRLQFTRTNGTKKVEMQDLEQTKKNRDPKDASAYIVVIVEGGDVIYIAAIGRPKLEAVIGKEKVARLDKIMEKYKK